MNPLTQVRNQQEVTAKEAEKGISDSASWHARYKHSAYIFVGGLPYSLTEGDVLAVFSQYGELVDVNLVRDRETGKSRGFAFLAYEDQRSTILAVDNLNGARVGGRIIRVEHVDDYKVKREQVEGKDAVDQAMRRNADRIKSERGEAGSEDGAQFHHDPYAESHQAEGKRPREGGNAQPESEEEAMERLKRRRMQAEQAAKKRSEQIGES